MARHESNARLVEDFLAQHHKVRKTLWPGSVRHPQHELAKAQMRNFSGLMSFSVKAGSLDVARQLADRLKVFSFAVSLGKTKSLMFYIPTDDILRSSFHLDGAAEAEFRDWAGEGVFRVSVGLEEPDDLIGDLEMALG
jgi:cystathionine gamma-synthase/methionine-gamma-lyase